MNEKKLPVHIAFGLAAQEGAVQGQIALWRWSKAINRLRAALFVVFGAMFAYSSFAVPALATTTTASTNCNGLNGILGIVNMICDFLIGVGAATSLLMFAIAGCLYIFGGTPARAAKGMEIIKQTVVALVVLVGGGVLKGLILAFAPSNDRSSGTTCQGAS